ncbi:aminotransferase class I/II-fold pyridoxal phosphate-dependent enzyme [Nisaea sp.]|uniref:aminotransferase class I/II-fold pyridoxal phosphate-dependent enzyme n=1 Tax=Nisaea sp. TaxID=2024842 RepID=UPI002B277DAF|nr:aminotransferase class I/II-fold pyridoxal phosphate-dependent enzyme [Nisaea sp.]
MAKAKAVTGKHSLSQYYNASSFRADTWNRLKNHAQRLAEGRGREKDVAQVGEMLALLGPMEEYFAFPGRHAFHQIAGLLQEEDFETLFSLVKQIVGALMSESYRRKHVNLSAHIDPATNNEDDEEPDERMRRRPYFEVLIVDDLSQSQQRLQREELVGLRREEDDFTYEPVFVPSFEDALIAILFNQAIQSVVIRFGFRLHSNHNMPVLQRYLNQAQHGDIDDLEPQDYGIVLADIIASVRPELDLFLVTDQAVEDIAGRVGEACRRVFYNREDFLELHTNILRGIDARYETPFFTALKHYSKQPTGVFHALPISRGKSIVKSHWIQDMGEFYGMNIFMAETSATSGGLDSLLEPHGPIKKAQELAARAFGSRETFFATNGTSTCNKIVVQALVRPGDIVLVDRDCHKSHHYGMVLTGAEVIYLDSYPLNQYSMYGAVPLREIKKTLLELRKAGKLHRVKMLLLTNCTFDGIVYNVERFMEECLAIKPDLVFLWDEAWFGFARFGPTYRTRTGMHAAETLRRKYRSAEYKKLYATKQKQLAKLDPDDVDAHLGKHLYPDPDHVRIRVYTTQSTHKTLTSLRQGSMIHMHDQDFSSKVEEPFHEAYMTHTSTSPNYQILASLDVGRRQVELEGFELVQKQVELAMILRQRIRTHPLLSKHFKVLTVGDMIPSGHRQSGIESYYDPERGWNEIWDAWAGDEFCLDATRVTLFVGGTGLDGDSFKNEILMDKFGIQINKTSRNTVLFMTNIGTTRSSIAYLIEVLVKIANDLEEQAEDMNGPERKVQERKVHSLTYDLPPLPDFSRFHDAFRPDAGGTTPEGDMRTAYFLAYDEDECEYLGLTGGSLEEAMNAGRELVSATFVIPYPPGFPILVPGQVISAEIIEFLRNLDVKEIHGYRPDLGLRVFTEESLNKRL